MKVNSRVELEFAGITLPIGKDAEGRDIVPAKPISDVFGLKWEEQRIKISQKPDTCTPDSRGAASYLSRRLGTCVVAMYYAGQQRDMVCIRLDRVAAYLNSIEPERVRGGGNETGADFLEAKQEEWDDLLHEYETRHGGMLQSISGETRTKAINIRLYLSVLRAKRDTNDEADRTALTTMAKALAAEAGAPYQADLIS